MRPWSSLHNDMPPLWRGDHQIAPHGSDFPPGLKTHRAQERVNVIMGQNANLCVVYVLVHHVEGVRLRTSGIVRGSEAPDLSSHDKHARSEDHTGTSEWQMWTSARHETKTYDLAQEHLPGT